jgi:hypothetical protein
LANGGDTVDSLRGKINLPLHPDAFISCDLQDDNQMPFTSPPESALSVLTREQHSVASQIIDAVMKKTDQFFVLQGSAGTGKTFTFKALIKALESTRRKCLICGTTGIGAVQYPGGTTLHSLFHPGIGEQIRGSFRSNVGRGTPLVRHILAADLIIIYEVSMLTPWMTNRVSITLQSISGQSQQEFGGKQILFVGDLLQLPKVVSNFSMPVVYRLITRLSYWPSIRRFPLKRPMRAPEPLWADFLLSIAKGRHMIFRVEWNSRHDFVSLSPRASKLSSPSSIPGSSRMILSLSIVNGFVPLKNA